MLEFWKKGCLDKSTPGLKSFQMHFRNFRWGSFPSVSRKTACETGPAAGLNTDFLPLDGDECAHQLMKSSQGLCVGRW